MAKISRFEDLETWQLAREICNVVYEFTMFESFSRDFSLKDQIRRSSGSVMDNIAEGFERDGRKEFRQYLSIAKASCGETRSQLYRAFDLKYVSKEDFDTLYDLLIVESKKISAFIKYLQHSEFKGNKYKN
ncbi:MAG TPA: four helix bundle protein [Salinivirga sp.]|uniref:Four helix bundle protein n=1 Tax=Salinivirga cyanobacteriivorans TaxID=1307839 RepID=A0A0S2HYJ8_9BACT|nr:MULTISPECIES: four helix bundle protein [Salinivirga]ALO15146.1 four helix bundle protein [Salinivirga cyanobacteriivorans]HKK60671.1 four helix bundle protein [Salinivirga sp.]